MCIVIRQLNELAQWSKKVFIFYKHVVIAKMLHIMVWNGNYVNLELKAAILPVSALQQAFIWTTCHPILQKKQKSHYKQKKEKKRKGLCTVPYLFAYFLKQKQVQFTTS